MVKNTVLTMSIATLRCCMPVLLFLVSHSRPDLTFALAVGSLERQVIDVNAVGVLSILPRWHSYEQTVSFAHSYDAVSLCRSPFFFPQVYHTMLLQSRCVLLFFWLKS